MEILSSVAELRARLPVDNVVLVPTMGGLHDGHIALVRQARQLGGFVAVSIYVNPLQFGVNEDFASYPRRLEADCEKLHGLADLVFAPDDAVMYPQKQTVTVALPPVADDLCGRSRPGFFQGVATVVCKLFNMVRPSVAVFGGKDYQQAFIIKMLVRQFALPIDIIVGATVRAADGLALSSRNNYLSADERQRAPLLYATLTAAAAAIAAGGEAAAVEADGQRALNDNGMVCDYFTVRAADTLGAPAAGGDTVVLAAAMLGKTRLIDNIVIPAAEPTITPPNR